MTASKKFNSALAKRPIIFSTPMVQAILDGKKTQTRRKVKPQPVSVDCDDFGPIAITGKSSKGLNKAVKCPYGNIGDLIWVRESYIKSSIANGYMYKADLVDQGWHFKWKTSIHMPKAAARIWLRITGIEIERLHDICEGDAKAEGWGGYLNSRVLGDDPMCAGNAPITWFVKLWKSINGEESWAANPYVWVVYFEVISTTGKPDFSPKIQKRL